MFRSFITVILTYVITHLFFWISGFNPNRDLPSFPGTLIDLGIWLLVFLIIYWFLGVLGVRAPTLKNGRIKT